MNTPTPRDQLAQIIAHTGRGHTGHIAPIAPVLAATILTAGWRPPARVIRDVEELDGLLNSAVILDAKGRVRVHCVVIDADTDQPEHWWSGTAFQRPSATIPLPAILIWEPDAEDEP